MVINKDGIGDDRVLHIVPYRRYPARSHPHDRRVATAYAQGQLVSDVLPEYDGVPKSVASDDGSCSDRRLLWWS